MELNNSGPLFTDKTEMGRDGTTIILLGFLLLSSWNGLRLLLDKYPGLEKAIYWSALKNFHILERSSPNSSREIKLIYQMNITKCNARPGRVVPRDRAPRSRMAYYYVP